MSGFQELSEQLSVVLVKQEIKGEQCEREDLLQEYVFVDPKEEENPHCNLTSSDSLTSPMLPCKEEYSPVEIKKEEDSGLEGTYPARDITRMQQFGCGSSNSPHNTRRTGEKPHQTSHQGLKPNQHSTSGETSSSGFNRYPRKQPGEKPHRCSVCGKAFGTPGRLREHTRIHTGEKPYQCPTCGMRFRVYTFLTKHKRHHTGEKPHQCTLCGKSFVRRSCLQRHHMTHTEERPYQCSTCGRTYKNSSSFRTHQKRHHSDSNVSRMYECDVCGKTYKNSTGLKDHKISHTGEKSYQCATCGKCFMTSTSLTIHERCHKALERIYKCPECGKGFCQKMHLTAHQRIHGGDKPHQCTVCGKSYRFRCLLLTHKLVHTGSKPHQCTLCDKSFVFNSYLKLHYRAHAGEKPYQCAICGKNYASSSSLSRHRLRHSADKPYKCTQCGKGFVTKLELKKHKERQKMTDVGDIRAAIIHVLPALPEETIEPLFLKIQALGASEVCDLKYIREEDLADLVSRIQCRKLVEAWKHTGPDSGPEKTPVLPTSQQSSPLPNPGPSGTSTAPNPQRDWPETFQVSREKMPPGVISAILKGRRPSPADRRQMVRMLVDDMRKHEPNPTKAQCRTVVKSIVKQYPKSFADTLDDGQTMIGGGYSSLLNQVKVRVEHVNRSKSLARHITKKDGTNPTRGPTDGYGCTRWQPDMPSGETLESLQALKENMMDFFSREGMAGLERTEVQAALSSTYCLQRKMINSIPAPSLEQLRSEWPFLFSTRGICAHFETLTDVQILRKMEVGMEEHGRALTDYFKLKSTNDKLRAVLSGHDGTPRSILHVLMAHFKEEMDGLFIKADMSATAADLESSCLPSSPRLILRGPESNAESKWMVSTEGRVICEGSSFLTGLSVLFACYYVFNVKYQDEAAATLEFIQRCFIGINPERGMKSKARTVTSKKNGKLVQKKTQPNSRVCSLMKAVMDFKFRSI